MPINPCVGLGGSGNISYQWQISGSAAGTYADISGATGAVYTPAAGDAGQYLKVQVAREGFSGSVTSSATAVVARADTPEPTVTEVRVAGPDSIAKGRSANYTAAVTGTDNPPQTVIWSIVEPGRKTGTAISSTGALSVAGDETLASITVKAASTFDPDQYGTKTVAVTGDGGGGEQPTALDAEDFGENAVVARRFNVYNETTWNAACSAIQSGGNDKNYVITLTGDVSIPGSSSGGVIPVAYTFGSVTGITVSLRGANILSLSSSGRLLSMGDNQNLVLRGSTLNGKTSNNASLLFISGGNFTMHDGIITGNSSSSTQGGGVYITNGNFTMNGGVISDNSSVYTRGGGVHITNGNLTMNSGEISGNSGNGGVYITNGDFTMNNGKISGNTSSSYGGNGGVYVGGDFIMSGGEISGNTGGGVYVAGSGSFTMSGGVISGNYNGVQTYTGDFTMSGGEISGNSAPKNNGLYLGGGIGVIVGFPGSSGGSDFTMTNGKISGNSSGGVYVVRASHFTMNGGEISGNSASEADRGGGVSVYGSFTLNSGEISGNTSSYYGSGSGGVYVVFSSANVVNGFTMSGGEISGNTASSRGGGVYIENMQGSKQSSFNKTGGGVIYGSDAGNASLKNTAGAGNTNGHAVYYYFPGFNNINSYYCYRDATLDTGDDISTSDTLPVNSGQTVGFWTRK
jgi:hypothetical protein